jgi:branched-chain amino acid transport system substrate-binding protein
LISFDTFFPDTRRQRAGLAITVIAGLTIALAGCKPAGQANSGAAGSGGGSSSPAPSGNGIVIGEYSSFTGSEADFGNQTDLGIKLALDDRNKAGGVSGKQVSLETEDDTSDASKAETAVKRLIDEKHVVAVLGEVASSASLAGGKVCQEKQIPMISPSSTKPAVTVDNGKLKDFVFRVCFTDPYQAAVVARFAKDGLHADKVAIFTNKSQAYSVGFSEEFKKAFTKYGGAVVSEQSYSPTDQDFRAQLTTIKQSNPQAILVPGYYSDAGSIAKQARDIGITVPLLGGDGWDSQDLLKIGGPAVNGCYFSNHMAISDPSPKVQDFVKAYRAKYNKEPGALAALGYDAANVLFDAMGKAKSLGGADIRDAIAATKDFDGVTGKITIDENHNAKKSAVIIAVKDGKFVYQTTVPDPDQPLKM